MQQWLVIDNPYASDAKVDVTLRTSSGVRRPDALQGLDIARRSREVIAIHDVAVRQDRVAVAVDAEVGSVVAAQTLVYTTAAGTAGRRALDRLTGRGDRLDVRRRHRRSRDSTAVVAIANVGGDDAQVDVQATPESSKQALVPTSLTVAQDDVAWVQLGQCGAASSKACINIPAGCALQPRRTVRAERRDRRADVDALRRRARRRRHGDVARRVRRGPTRGRSPVAG